jgi:hypothetical protein
MLGLSKSEMHFDAEIHLNERFISTPISRQFGDPLGGHDRASMEMYLESRIE